MPKFTTNTVSINYSVYGTGIPVILLHGAIVDFNYNYIQTGWIKSLSENGFQVIGIDFRGYGESDKSNDPNFYGTTNLADDVIFETLLPSLADLLSYETFPSHLPSHISAYWNFFKQIGLEKEAMIAFSLAKYPPLTAEKAAGINIPTLIISGEKDLVLGTGQKVAQTLPNGKYLEIKEATHFTLARERETHLSTVTFLIGA